MMQTQASALRSRFAKVVRQLARDQRGDALQNVLLLAVAAVGIYVGFQFLWGKNNTGVVAIMIEKVETTFQNRLFSWW